MSASENDNVRPQATEQTPLLRDADPADSGPAEGQEQQAEEPSTKELILVLSSIWLGVFLAALGMHICA